MSNTAQTFIDVRITVPPNSTFMVTNYYNGNCDVRTYELINMARVEYVNNIDKKLSTDNNKYKYITTKTNALVDMDNLRYRCG